MYKKFFILLTNVLLLTGCYCNSDPREQTTHKQTFIVIERSYINGGNKRVIVRDTETNVLYMDCYYGFVPLLNSDGTPKLYKK